MGRREPLGVGRMGASLFGGASGIIHVFSRILVGFCFMVFAEGVR